VGLAEQHREHGDITILLLSPRDRLAVPQLTLNARPKRDVQNRLMDVSPLVVVVLNDCGTQSLELVGSGHLFGHLQFLP